MDNKRNIEPRFNIEEAAEYLGINKESVRNLVYINKLKPLNREYGIPVRDWVFSKSELEKRKELADNNKGGMGGGWRSIRSKRLKYFGRGGEAKLNSDKSTEENC